MGGPLSPNLIDILGLQKGSAWDDEVDVQLICESLANHCGRDSPLARAHFRNRRGKVKIKELVSLVSGIVPHDSTVRDMLTTGHLAKLLSRWDVRERTGDYRILGLPNSLFDKLSWEERRAYFRVGVTHDFDGDLLDNREAQEMLERETNLQRAASQSVG